MSSPGIPNYQRDLLLKKPLARHGVEKSRLRAPGVGFLGGLGANATRHLGASQIILDSSSMPPTQKSEDG